MKLLACPFCGGKADFECVENRLSPDFCFWSVGCMNSEVDCIAYQMMAHYNTKGEAAEAWNKRCPH